VNSGYSKLDDGIASLASNPSQTSSEWPSEEEINQISPPYEGGAGGGYNWWVNQITGELTSNAMPTGRQACPAKLYCALPKPLAKEERSRRAPTSLSELRGASNINNVNPV
jgi:hypothetical protein